ITDRSAIGRVFAPFRFGGLLQSLVHLLQSVAYLRADAAGEKTAQQSAHGFAVGDGAAPGAGWRNLDKAIGPDQSAERRRSIMQLRVRNGARDGRGNVLRLHAGQDDIHVKRIADPYRAACLAIDRVPAAPAADILEHAPDE